MRERKRAGRLTRLQPAIKSLAAQKGVEYRAPDRTAASPPGPSPVLTPARSSCLCQLTSDRLVVLLLLFGFPLIRTEVIRHFRRFNRLSCVEITQHLPRFRWCLPFSFSPEVEPAPRTLYSAHRRRKRGLGDARWRRGRGSGK